MCRCSTPPRPETARRADPSARQAQRHPLDGAAARCESSSILFYMGVHDVDAMQWIGRSRIARVYAQKRRGARHRQRGRALCRAQLRERRDRQPRLFLGLARRADERLPLGVRDRRHAVGGGSSTCRTRASTSPRRGTTGGDTHLWPEINGRIAGGLADEIDHFVKATLAGAPYLQHYREAFDAIPVLDALAESARNRQPVDVSAMSRLPPNG